MTATIIYQVAVPTPLRRLFDYLPPSNQPLSALPNEPEGCRVNVHFGNRQVVGVVVSQSTHSTVDKSSLKAIDSFVDDRPIISSHMLAFVTWAANYYHHPIGEALLHSMPALLRKGEPLPSLTLDYWHLTTQGKGLPDNALSRAPKQQALLNLLQQQPAADNKTLRALGFSSTITKQLREKGIIAPCKAPSHITPSTPLLAEEPLTLTSEQQQALDNINISGYSCTLLNGATGSGKTEVYLQLIHQVLAKGAQVLVLIPEISLSPQTLARFQARFHCGIAASHSNLSNKERALAWSNAAKGNIQIILGTRSAIFTPFKNLGLIIVDEEHDGSFKQQEGFRYSARDMAIARAKQQNIPVLLGSATPSLESIHNAQQGRYKQLRLRSRPGLASAPHWQLVDMVSHTDSAYSNAFIAAATKELQQGCQILVFLNRRGYAPTLQCSHCGWVATCHHCDIRMTVHRTQHRLICHQCEHWEPLQWQCPNCNSSEVACVGQGTERSEDILSTLFPDTPIIRIDSDTTQRKQALPDMLEQINRGDPCILVGTQLLAKGHHFPNVTLVAVLDADSGLFSADFRAAERLGQLITQVAGRAGRGELPGKVLIQTEHGDHPLIQSLVNDDYDNFCQSLMAERLNTRLPPYSHLCLIRASATDAQLAQQFLQQAKGLAENPLSPVNSRAHLGSLRLIGPLPSPIEKRAGRYRFQLALYNQHRKELHQSVKALCQQLEQHTLARKVRWSVDMDPQEML